MISQYLPGSWLEDTIPCRLSCCPCGPSLAHQLNPENICLLIHQRRLKCPYSRLQANAYLMAVKLAV